MGNYDFLEKLKDDEALLFKRCIRKLLDATFIVEDRDEKLYQYISIESNHYDISSYLRIMGYDVIVEDKLKVAMLIQNEDDEDTVGIKRSNLLRFDNRQVQILMILWLLYLERVGFSEGVYVTTGDIVDKLKIYGVEVKPTEFKDTLKLFKKFSLIGFNENETTEDSKVKLYSSLQFCMDIAQLKQVMAEHLPEDQFDSSEDGDVADELEEE
jgi:hypothetical protein